MVGTRTKYKSRARLTDDIGDDCTFLTSLLHQILTVYHSWCDAKDGQIMTMPIDRYEASYCLPSLLSTSGNELFRLMGQ